MPRNAQPTGSSTPRRADGRPADVEDPSPRLRPAAAGLLGIETLLLLAAATFCFVMVSAGNLHARLGTGLGIFLIIFAVGTALASRSVLVKGRFGLGYGITWQMFQALVASSMLRGGMYWQGALGLALAIAVFVLLLRLVRSTPLPDRAS
ncbi:MULTISPECIES: hypothetical protein [Brachybacterium]|uniref:Uncharacterized protein n=1 Tax=Brachybacterium alimentarium TaxID=47845 RepID=A0A2A3YIT1_9MICO|nr:MULTISPECIES: hypothetical protein [Brachybacterium]PCC35702.1 hypothetical protein CIK71_01875 [Brachybacterium alimentarium]PCC39230.1 hypothetical protein CIK66_10165 [Brachybacterium alimentarium]RCS64378.1 hypothetical protein CIK81_09940 [Brachybacterium sp. JB7]RCS66517.1 hypothetical protein CIK73_11875 [Brachybacterium alimentarium]RCS67918.1 hypothetical protein CIK68_13675 [Brachybacterium alimentarium]